MTRQKRPIIDFSGSADALHEDWKGDWAAYLRTCEVRGRAPGVVYYGNVNCNYILFLKQKVVVRNYGFHGDALLKQAQKNGAAAVFKRLREAQAKSAATMSMLRSRLS
jgi:fatty acid/phospholipid biosynthesis enzyme